jgi:hypothetical protein
MAEKASLDPSNRGQKHGFGLKLERILAGLSHRLRLHTVLPLNYFMVAIQVSISHVAYIARYLRAFKVKGNPPPPVALLAGL